MSSNCSANGTALSVQNVGKCYEIYDRAHHRLLQTIWHGRKKFYRDFWALRDVSFDVRSGESLGIIGRNGSGKSTLLQIIAGVLPPTIGQVEVQGRLAALLELGSGFNPDFTGRENVYMSASILGLTRAEISAKYDEIVAFAEIGDFIDQPVRTYSSGMVLRLAFAVQIHVRPDILVIDEALAVGDVFFVAKCSQYFKQALRDTTKVFVTHDITALSNLCSRAILLKDGLVQFDGDTAKCIEEYTKELHHGIAEEDESAHGDLHEDIVTANDFHGIPEDKLSGSLQAKILGYRVLVDGKPYGGLICPGQKVKVHFLIFAERAIPSIIIGYLLSDKFGTKVFGSTSLSSVKKLFSFDKKGSYSAVIYFTWPEVAGGDYLLTLGVGEGKDPIFHKVHCWSHNVCSLTSSAHNIPVHAMFNNHIDRCDVSEIRN